MGNKKSAYRFPGKSTGAAVLVAVRRRRASSAAVSTTAIFGVNKTQVRRRQVCRAHPTRQQLD